jgi:YVTN family beta-propeller protein
MKKTKIHRPVNFSVLVLLMASTVLAQNYLSPQHICINEASNRVFVSCATASSIAVFDVEKKIVASTIDINNPAGVVSSANGKYLFALESSPDGTVHKIDVKSGRIIATCSVGHSPHAVALSSNEKLLVVSNQFSHDVSIIKTEQMKEHARVPVLREPSGIAISPDDRFAVVLNSLPSGSMTQETVAAEISFIDVQENVLIKNIKLINGSTALKDVCFSPDGQFIYATHILARYQLPTTQLERGWMNTNALSIIDAGNLEFVNTVLLDDVDLGAANPCGVRVSKDGASLYIALSGTHELFVLDRLALHEKLQAAENGTLESDIVRSADDVYIDLSFLYDIKKRIPLNGKGPRYIAVSDDEIFVTDYFSAGLDVLDLATLTPRFVSLANEPEMSQERLGELYFHDASLCFQHWQSCASCHPGGARVDGLNWDLLNDGIGNPKNTKSLLLSHVLPPAMITGIRPDAETAVRAGIRHIQFIVRPDEDAQAIDAYLKNLEPIKSPYLVNDKLTKSAKRGKQIFESAGCGDCHSGPHFSNQQKYNVGTGLDRHAETEFDTPTLIEVWRTAPYLYDGRAATLQQVFQEFNQNDQHGQTLKLSEKELHDLIAYVNTL